MESEIGSASLDSEMFKFWIILEDKLFKLFNFVFFLSFFYQLFQFPLRLLSFNWKDNIIPKILLISKIFKESSTDSKG